MMQDAIATALEKKDFRTAATLLQQWKQQDAKDPKFLLMVGKYQEATGRWEQSEKTYLKLLRLAPSPKLMSQARQGIQRVQSHITQAREEAIENARAQVDGQDPGLLCLEPVQGEHRQVAAQGLAKVMGMDAYTARLQLPSKGWRLYRTGPVGDLQVYSQELVEAQVPAFWVKHAEVKAIQVFNVEYFRRVQGRAEVVCKNAEGQLGAITFDWSEVSQIVLGQLPIFELVVDTNARRQLQRKEQTQDHTEIIDLQFQQRRCILRLCDRTYDFRHGNPLPNAEAIPDRTLSTRPQWQALSDYLQTQVRAPVQKNFTHFGESAMEFLDLLPSLNHQIQLARIKETNWDPAFHLYSGIHFLRQTETA
ncbi:tetratricopeptide repeat protein [Oscillatoria sp. CS-180]|uniref:tetratricopeptide repeat protein n=1 Tax=Oscillatoria sp. CS-180 TaxID=3021720 RepID=UPI00232EE8F5|nr:tetratricopeptide repeat protein [Oscillatoria sp. CS-180]MDB9527809.1 tetratricopeptide repeat protein [Oscillatoria sp. CS-180]